MKNITNLKGVKEVTAISVYEVIDDWVTKTPSSTITKVSKSVKKYDKRGFCSSMEDGLGNVFEMEYNDNGIITKELMNGELKYEAFVDSAGNLTGEIDHRNNSTTSYDNIYTENSAGETILTEVTEVLKQSIGETVRRTITTKRKFNAFGSCISEESFTDHDSWASSIFTKFDYDESNNLIHEITQYRDNNANNPWKLAYETKNTYGKYPTGYDGIFAERYKKVIRKDPSGTDFDKYDYIFSFTGKDYEEVEILNSYHDGVLKSISTHYYDKKHHLVRWTSNNIGGPILQGFNEFNERGEVIRFTDLLYRPDGNRVEKIVTDYEYTYYKEEAE